MNELTSPSGVLAVIERAATDPKVDVDKMERLFALQERMFDRHAEQQFNRAMMQVQSECRTIGRNASNDQTRSRYTTLDKINSELVPIYTRHGFALSFGTGDAPQGLVRITCTVMHESGHSRDYHYDLPLDDSGIKGTANKTQVHATGSTTSYGRRYLTMLIFNVATGDDIDGNQPEKFALISAEQKREIEALITKVGANPQQFLQYLKIPSLDQLPERSYQMAVKALEAKGRV